MGGVRRSLPAFLALGVVLALGGALLRGPSRPPRHLVQFGWDEPDTAFLRAHVERMQRSPFDGCVFHATWRDGQGRPAGNLAWRAWGRERVPPAALLPAIRDLRATRFGRFRQNFLRLNVTPGDAPWLDEAPALLANLRLASQVAAAGAGVRGFVIDTEAYETPLWSYRHQADRGRRAFPDYAAAVRGRGREVGRALRSAYPDAVIILTFGTTVALWEAGPGRRPLDGLYYGLLPAFVDGLVDVSPRDGVVDGFELSYGYRTPAEFADGRGRMTSDVLRLVSDPVRYRRVVRAGFGLWLDYDQRRLGWDMAAPGRNYFTPQGLEQAVAAALEASDGYVWIYNEVPRFWTEPAVPAPYLDALRRARAGALTSAGRGGPPRP
jgi:hypothetical protein